MILVSSFLDVVQQVSLVMTAPTFSSLVTVLTGWAFARRRVVTRMIEADDGESFGCQIQANRCAHHQHNLVGVGTASAVGDGAEHVERSVLRARRHARRLGVWRIQ